MTGGLSYTLKPFRCFKFRLQIRLTLQGKVSAFSEFAPFSWFSERFEANCRGEIKFLGALDYDYAVLDSLKLILTIKAAIQPWGPRIDCEGLDGLLRPPGIRGMGPKP